MKDWSIAEQSKMSNGIKIPTYIFELQCVQQREGDWSSGAVILSIK